MQVFACRIMDEFRWGSSNASPAARQWQFGLSDGWRFAHEVGILCTGKELQCAGAERSTLLVSIVSVRWAPDAEPSGAEFPPCPISRSLGPVGMRGAAQNRACHEGPRGSAAWVAFRCVMLLSCQDGLTVSLGTGQEHDMAENLAVAFQARGLLALRD